MPTDTDTEYNTKEKTKQNFYYSFDYHMVHVVALSIKDEYEKSLAAYFKKIEETCMQYRIKYVPVSVDEKFEKILTTYLVEKQKFG